MDWILPHGVYDGGHCLGHDLAIQLDQGQLIALTIADNLPPDTQIKKVDAIAAFGLFDTQVNGGAGVLLNNLPTAEGVEHIAKAHRALGTEFILPTVISDTTDVIRRAAEGVLAQLGRDGVLGIHIEGPHINPLNRGTHRQDRIRAFDAETLDTIKTLRKWDCPVLLTLAPECVKSETIAILDQMGVVVSAGHSAADAEQTRQAIEAGLKAVTHLHNGMSPMTGRAPGLVGVSILSELWCGLIADGHHVSTDMIRLTLRACGHHDRIVLVSDAMPTVGGCDSFLLYDEEIHVDGGKLINKAGSLAGAHVCLSDCIAHMHKTVGVSIDAALSMASDNPFGMMGLQPPKNDSGRLVTFIPNVPTKS